MLIIFLVVGVILCVIVIFALPKIQLIKLRGVIDPVKKYELENELRKTIIQMTGGFFLIVSMIVTWNQLLQTKDKDVAEQINKTVTLMGDENEYVRIGAIYSIEQLASSHPESKGIVANILTSYVRSTFPWKNNKLPDRKNEVAQAALLVITKYVISTHDGTVDLSKTDLRRIELDGKDLSKCTFIETHFEVAELPNSNFKGSTLTGSMFDGANLTGASFIGANLSHASFKGTTFNKTNFSGADLSGVSGISKDDISSGRIIVDKFTKLSQETK